MSTLVLTENEYCGRNVLEKSSAAPETFLPHQMFRKSLKGQEASIPNLYGLFPEWSPKLHSQYERARDEVINPWLERWVDDPRTCMKFQKADFSIFAAIICADASFDKLCTVAKSFAWYFIWDDRMAFVFSCEKEYMAANREHATLEFDCGSLAYDTEGTVAYLKKTKEYFRYHLLQIGQDPDLSSFSKEQQKALLCWNEVGQHFREACSRDVCEVFLDKMLRYVASVDTIDSIFQGGKVPSLAEYWQRRDLTAGVYPVIATLPFVYGIEISKAHVKVRHWQPCGGKHHISSIFWADIIQRDNQIENLIPVLMMNYGLDCNMAMQRSFQMANDEAKGIRVMEDFLQKNHKKTNASSKILSDYFITGCKDVAMGLVYWSYSGERYFKKQDIADDQTIMIRI